MKTTTIDLNETSSDGKDYYDVVVDKLTKSFFMVKNAGCTAHVLNYLSSEYKMNWPEVQSRFVIMFNCNNPEPDRNRIFKKYHSIVF